LSPKSKIAHLSWGVDKTFFPALPYNPKFFLSCGRTQRDFRTLKSAAQGTAAKIQLLSPGPDANLDWSENVNVMTGGGVISQNSEIGYPDLIHKYYANTSAVLIVIKEDAAEATGVGFTNLIEAFAMGRPVIVTRTGAIATEIDIESAGVGLFVRPNSAEDLRSAMDVIASNSVNATAMATRALELSRKQYNIDRFAHQLHGFFSTF
jgi:glycosyltransferase involved in cell wall biosynthesis